MATKRYHPAILVSCEIPWDDGENLIEDVFRQEIRATLAQFDNLYIFGTAGACKDAVGNLVDRFWEPTKAFGELIDGAYDKMIVRASGIDMPLRLLEACVAGLRARHPESLA